jgi:Protein of unknown function (DUF2934)
MLLLDYKVAGQIELEGGVDNGDTATEAMQIEMVMYRAHEIHRAHGGLFGYDLEDWLQAERELFERNEPNAFRLEEATNAQPILLDQERDCKKCLGKNN